MWNNALLNINGIDITLATILVNIIFPMIITAVMAIVIYYTFGFILKAIEDIQSIKNKSKETESQVLRKDNLKNKVRKILILLTLLVFLGIILISLSNVFQINVSYAFTTPFYTLGELNISIISFFYIFIIAYASYWVSRNIRKLSKKVIGSLQPDISRRYAPLIQLSGYVTLVLCFLIGFSLLGVNFSSLTVIFGVLGVGLGFGLQDIVSNFFSGLVISFSGIIKEGDRVYLQEIEGDVQQINLINTTIRSLFYEELIVPNKFILNESIQNFSHSDKIVVIKCMIGVDYSSNLHHVKKVIVEAAEKLPFRIKNRDVIFRLKNFADSCVEVGVFVFIHDVKDKYQAQSDLNMMVWDAFQKEHIKIPFPQLDVHFKNTLEQISKPSTEIIDTK